MHTNLKIPHVVFNSQMSKTPRWHRKSTGNLFSSACEFSLLFGGKPGKPKLARLFKALIYANIFGDKGSPEFNFPFIQYKWDHPVNFTMEVSDNLPPFLDRWYTARNEQQFLLVVSVSMIYQTKFLFARNNTGQNKWLHLWQGCLGVYFSKESGLCFGGKFSSSNSLSWKG